MTRFTRDVTIPMKGRDEGKTFRITEMPCEQAEEWAMRAFFAMGRGGVHIPDEVVALGAAGLGKIAMENFVRIPWEDAKPLLDEIMTCVSSVQAAGIRRLQPNDIQEIATRLFLRKEVMELHLSFFGQGDSQISESSSAPTPETTSTM